MSSNGDSQSNLDGASSAIGVGFSSIADQYGESSSMAESRSSGKRSSRSEGLQKDPGTPEDKSMSRDDEPSSTGSLGRRNRKSGGFLLESAFANGSPKGPQDIRGKRKAQDGHLHVEKRRYGPGRLSGDSSHRGSPLSRELSLDVPNGDGMDDHTAPRSASVDPAQLVQMALNLSESRKRHVSNTLQVPMPSPRRATSAPMSNIGTVRAASSSRKRSSRLGNDISQRSPSSNGTGLDDVDEDAPPAIDFGTENILHTFTPATLSRAEKARKYFELASEHRRLLQHLPPLKPDSSAPGNYTFETKGSPGYTHPEITRVPSYENNKHALGRQYNPIQSLRNRRVRIREKRPFPASPEAFQDPAKVKIWIDSVETATANPGYRATENQVDLPPFSGEEEESVARPRENATRHRRTDTVGTVITRPENSWTIQPTELLADTYWTEQGDNKISIETRRGTPIFPPPPRKSIDTPKISIEVYRDRVEDVKVASDSEEDEIGRQSRRRRLIMPLVGTSERRKHRRILSRSSSTSSGSTREGRGDKNLTAYPGIGDENIGPLERHMQELIAKDENGELSSPEMTSPDHWGRKHIPYQRASTDGPHRDSLGQANGRPSLEVPRDEHRRSKSADGRVGSVDHAMSSTEDLESDLEPTSPVIARHVPSIGMDLSPPSETRQSLDGHRSRRLKLPGFRSNSKERTNSKERNKIDQMDFADGTGNNLSPILSGDSWRPKTSGDAERPTDFNRQKTNESMLSNLHRIDTSSSTRTASSMRDSGSSVKRFFKGGRERLGGLVRGDTTSDRLKARERLDAGALTDGSRTASDASDAEDGAKVNGHLRKRLTNTAVEDSDVSPRASLERIRSRPKYHTNNLPSFTSASTRDKRLKLDTTMSNTSVSTKPEQNTSRQWGSYDASDQVAQSGGKPTQESETSQGQNHVTFRAVKFDPGDKSYGELSTFGSTAAAAGGPGGISRAQRQRHWSIYDQVQPVQADKISSRDIARARALLLCSGIKAREIQRRGNNPRDPPSTHLVKAAETAGKSIGWALLKEEHLIAARMLSDHISTALSDFEGQLSRFQSRTAKDLATQLDDLQSKASEHLTTLVHETSDEADAFTVELTTKQVQQTKRVDEAVDDMLRQRRRQFRLLRKAGFKILEWLVLSIMWGIWFMVVVFNTCKRVVVGILRFLRWLFSF